MQTVYLLNLNICFFRDSFLAAFNKTEQPSVFQIPVPENFPRPVVADDSCGCIKQKVAPVPV